MYIHSINKNKSRIFTKLLLRQAQPMFLNNQICKNTLPKYKKQHTKALKYLHWFTKVNYKRCQPNQFPVRHYKIFSDISNFVNDTEFNRTAVITRHPYAIRPQVLSNDRLSGTRDAGLIHPRETNNNKCYDKKLKSPINARFYLVPEPVGLQKGPACGLRDLAIEPAIKSSTNIINLNDKILCFTKSPD